MLAKNKIVPQADLGRILVLDRSTISRDLSRLVDQGYVDRKGVINKIDLQITKKGKDYMECIIPDWEKAKDESSQILGDDGEKALDLVLAKLTRHKAIK